MTAWPSSLRIVQFLSSTFGSSTLDLTHFNDQSMKNINTKNRAETDADADIHIFPEADTDTDTYMHYFTIADTAADTDNAKMKNADVSADTDKSHTCVSEELCLTFCIEHYRNSTRRRVNQWHNTNRWVQKLLQIFTKVLTSN